MPGCGWHWSPPTAIAGEVSERSKEHAWKVCMASAIEGSNPSLSARWNTQLVDILLCFSCGVWILHPFIVPSRYSRLLQGDEDGGLDGRILSVSPRFVDDLRLDVLNFDSV